MVEASAPEMNNQARSWLRRRAGIIAAAALVVCVLGVARSYRPRDTPFTPHDDSEVLARVPAGQVQSELRQLEALLAQQRDNLDIAIRVARLHMAAGRRSGDARELSYAESALAPWWDLADPPAPALLLRATIRQTRHEFAASLVDLDVLVTRTPRDPQPWLTRATVLTVLGRYDEAATSCTALQHLASPLVVTTCRALVDAPTDRVKAARDSLTLAMGGFRVDPNEASWARSVRGELSLYAGDAALAEKDLRQALAEDPDDVYSRSLLADLLLDAHRDADVLALIATDEVNEVLLLRRAIAGKHVHAPDAQELAERLRATTNALRERGDTTHQREEARLVSEVEGDVHAALPIAVANWAVQHEAWDARVLLETAAAAGGEGAKRAAPALDWWRSTHCTWPPVVAAATALGAAR